MTAIEYVKALNEQYSTGRATEHSYRGALGELLSTILPSDITVVNEPKRERCGAPDYVLTRGEVSVGYLEAKDFAQSSDLAGKRENKEQFDRYKHSLGSIIFTNYLDFWWYVDGEFVEGVELVCLCGERLELVAGSEARFESLIERLGQSTPQRITSSSKLAQIMAGKARLMADVIERILTDDTDQQSDLHGQMEAFRTVLIDDIEPSSFSDIYAQTITYGMFAARLHDPTPETFSRQEAATLIPKSNPFLRSIFQSIAGYDLDDRVSWIVDDLAEVFRATDLADVMRGYGQRTAQTDPILHFYEDFLGAYDPSLRKSRGVWYTPQPVVNYIVRAVDEVLRNDFALPLGLADTSKTRIKVRNQKAKKSDKDTYEIDVHKVQILDPATDTGTFLSEVVRHIHGSMASQAGMWQGYVEEHLLPRLNGFEILMASYAMAHLKLDMQLSDTGYTPTTDKRLRIFLTNSLEEHHSDTGTLFVQALANEANQASHIKRDTPVMVMMGNPPYSGISKNNGQWITDLISAYKKEPGGVDALNEKKHWLNDDYCKFIRLGQHFVDKNQEGVLAYVNSHSFLDNPTFRGMRWSLMESFDKIYIIDLHGNSKKKETAPDGSKDENVFDIQQGVSINIFVKTGKKKEGELAEVYHYDLFGKRQSKYDFLADHTLATTPYQKLSPQAPMYFFVPKDTRNIEEYVKGFSVAELFTQNTTGIVTARDKVVIDCSATDLRARIEDFCNPTNSDAQLRAKFWSGKKDGKYLAGDSRGWKLSNARNVISSFEHEKFIKPIAYRPFDNRYIYYSSHMVDWGREKIMCHMLAGDNVGLVTARQCASDWRYVFITKNICEFNLTGTAGKFGSGNLFPLYVYPEEGATTIDGAQRVPNLKPEIVAQVAKVIGREFEHEKSGNSTKFAPIDMLDYIYGVLHTPEYRNRYKEFLKTDFPRIPMPESAEQFARVGAVGAELRHTHLMEELQPLLTTFPVAGNNTVETITTVAADAAVSAGDNSELLDVYINDTQYFGGVPKTAWELHIGGYQPAQKWLKDRRGQTLTFDSLLHYQRIITALSHHHSLTQKL